MLRYILVVVFMIGSMAGRPAQAEGDPAKGEKVFQRCAACHSLDEGVHRVGPSLAGLFGRPAGAIADFRYSDAMTAAQVTWDAESLDAYLENPRAYIPGNRMPFPGLSDSGDRADLIAFLRQATSD